ncbi:hypothetical protein [Fibrella forsythiae]|uniref:Uncharacterized protein n=1 Tax=Fibrella forsythiae TaxID=2817061 RepID=A0ABS3JBW5_9BACT|nr:hypothetical protein [Fibrella forsythiae]MBO0947480.1 hypothetical protein [Fibrella forsythiae]
MTSLLVNPYFWLGQIGLLAIVITCQALIEIRQKTAKRAYIYSLWLGSGLALWCMGTPLTGGHPLPAPIYLLQFATGLIFTLGYFQVRASPGLVVSVANTVMLRKILIGVGGGGLLIICAISLVIAYKEHKAQTGQDTKQTAAILDTKMKARNDSLTKEVLRNRAETAELKQTINQQATQLSAQSRLLDTLTDIIISLKQAIVRLNVTVERTRKSTFTPPRITLPEQSTVVSPGRVPKAN